MENLIQALAMGIGGAFILLGLAYWVVMHEAHARRIYRVKPLENWNDRETR